MRATAVGRAVIVARFIISIGTTDLPAAIMANAILVTNRRARARTCFGRVHFNPSGACWPAPFHNGRGPEKMHLNLAVGRSLARYALP